MIEEKELIEELREIVSDVCEVEKELIEEDSDFIEDLEISSLMALEVMLALEKKYNFKLTEREMTQARTLGELCELVTLKNSTVL